MKTILIVEDNTNAQLLYQRALHDAGYKVISQASVDAARQALTQPVDLVMLDIMLQKGQNGFDLLEEMKRDPAFQQIPVMIITNLDSEEKVARSIGADDYLVKANVSMDQIVQRVKKLVPLD